MFVNRRAILSGLVGAGLAAAQIPRGIASSVPHLKIKDVAAGAGVLFGSAFDVHVLRDKAYAQLLKGECQLLTSDYSVKFGSIRPHANVVRFGSADQLVAFAEKSNLLFRGHNLIWNEFVPDWVTHLSAKEVAALLDRHIEEVVGRYAGRVQSWDVVNEPIWPDHHNIHGLRGGPWFAALGPDYIDRSFRRARQTDPHAKLVLNEAGLEFSTSKAARRRRYLLELVQRLLDKAVPLDAIGFESHIWAPLSDNREGFLAFTESIQKLGLDIYISELDVYDLKLPDDIETRDRLVASCYKQFLSDVLKFSSVKIINTWELSDKYTWRADEIRSGRTPNERWPRPLPFDYYMHPKPAYYAIVDALRKA